MSDAQPMFDPLPEPQLPSLDRPWNTVVAGVGGTGVLTITALVAMAAHIEGKGCATLNQTGLAQKFGAVVSHVRVAADQDDIKAVRIPAGEADLLIGCDLVVTTGYEAMGKSAHGRTHAIVNDNEQPTAAFILDPDARFPAKSMHDKVRDQVGEEVVFVNATRIATKLTGDAIGTNLFLLGYAWQMGWVPVSREALERAIELNGVAIEFNKQAFLLGRRYAVQPERVEAMLPEQRTEAPKALTLDELIEDRHQRLVDYQNTAYAQRYLDRINKIRATDPAPESEASLTYAAAKQLYKLMAYKDEYEVARLHSDKTFREKLEAQFDGDFELRFHLAPPIISKVDPETGKMKKREFGPWMMQAFQLLAKFKWLRGTRFDVFALTEERKLERNDLAQYEQDLETLLSGLTTDNYDLAVELADLPGKLRGYGHVKARNRAELAERREALFKAFNGDVPFFEVGAKRAA